jgi:hypothetical protein
VIGTTMDRRRFLVIAAGVLLAEHGAAGAHGVVDLYKTSTCGCCKAWADYMRTNGFVVRTHDVGEPAVYRRRAGIPDALGSCHTALVGAYAVAAAGLSVPAMPVGSPGMEQGPQRDPYDVLLVMRDGTHRVFARYPK